MKKEFNKIAKLISQNSKVLDVGCGDGELMKYIYENITNDIRGLELSKHNVPLGHVKTFGDFLKTKTAKNFITNAKIDNKRIKVPKCAIEVTKGNSKEKTTVPNVGQDTNKILKKLGYSENRIKELKKKKIT